MTIKIKTNSLFKELTKNINSIDTNKFNISDFFDLTNMNLYIEKNIKDNENLYLIRKVDKNLIDINDLSWTERNNNEIWLGYKDIYFEPIFVVAKYMFDKYCELLQKHPQNTFKVILSIDNGESKNIVIRFYKIRNNEKIIVDDNIESYILNGIMVGYINF